LRIENTILYNLILDNKDSPIKEGSLFLGRILSISDDMVSISIEGFGTIEAELERAVRLGEGEEIFFQVKSASDEKVVLRPFSEEEFTPKSISKLDDNPIEKILKSINVESNKETIGLVENMMKHNIPLVKSKLISAFKTLEKLDELINLQENKKVILSDIPDTNGNKNEIDSGASLSPKDIDIKYLLVYDEIDETNKRDLRPELSGLLDNLHEEDLEDGARIISFMQKNNIQATLNNIKNMRELDQDPIKFLENLKVVYDKIEDLKLGNGEIKTIQTAVEDMDKRSITLNREKVAELSKMIDALIREKPASTKEAFDSIRGSLNLLKDLDENINFLFYPLYYDQETGIRDLLTLAKEGKKSGSKSKGLNIFINLNTNNLGGVKIYANVYGNSLSVKMYIMKEDLDLFKSAEKKVIENIDSIGYSVKEIEFVTSEKFSMIEHLASNPKPSYILDLRA